MARPRSLIVSMEWTHAGRGHDCRNIKTIGSKKVSGASRSTPMATNTIIALHARRFFLSRILSDCRPSSSRLTVKRRHQLPNKSSTIPTWTNRLPLRPSP